jgi:hypothetical protein
MRALLVYMTRALAMPGRAVAPVRQQLFFVLAAVIAAIAAAVLLLIDRPARKVLRDDRSALPAPAQESA